RPLTTVSGAAWCARRRQLEQPDRARAIAFFRSLADENRLRILGLLAGRERGVAELASILELKAPTVTRHLVQLTSLGLVQSRAEGDSQHYQLDMQSLRRLTKELQAPDQVATFGDDVAGDAGEQRVLQSFFTGERLKELPASRKKRLVVLKWLATRFAPGERYPEAPVNESL